MDANLKRDALSIATAITISILITSIGVAQPRSDTHIYGEHTLAHWKRRLVDFDAQSPSAARDVEPLLEILTDEQVDSITRRNAAVALGSIGPLARPATPQLVRMVESANRNEDPALWAAKALSLLGPSARDATPTLARIISDKDQPLALRQLCCEALGRIAGAHPDAISTLIHVIQANSDDNLQLRPLAVEALGVAGADAAIAVPILIRIIRNPAETEIMRRNSVTTLGKIGPAAAIAATPLAEAVLLDESPAVRDAAALALAEIGPSATVVLMQLLRNEDAGARWRAAGALGDVDSPPATAMSALRAALADDVEQVCLHAATALVKLKDEPRILAAAIVPLLQSTQRPVRLSALELIISNRNILTAAESELRRLSGADERAEVRRLAEIALRKIRDE